MANVYLGIDTSCYTTSVAVLDKEGNLLEDERIMLDVKKGHCGLKQSEMVFQHTRNLPKLLKKVFNRHDMKILGIGVSEKPRTLKESYMPAFLVGLGIAEVISLAVKCPITKLSHQENHLQAGLWSANGPKSNKFLMVHASGGTTEIHLVKLDDNRSIETIDLVGKTLDLNAGQFVDRVGVALGAEFPAGMKLEKLAKRATEKVAVPVSVQKNNLSFSGPETAVQKMIEQNIDHEKIALGVEYSIGEAFYRVLNNISLKLNINEVLLVGGVMSNQYIREYIITKLKKKKIFVFVPDNIYSKDNAVGTAEYVRKHLEK